MISGVFYVSDQRSFGFCSIVPHKTVQLYYSLASEFKKIWSAHPETSRPAGTKRVRAPRLFTDHLRAAGSSQQHQPAQRHQAPRCGLGNPYWLEGHVLTLYRPVSGLLAGKSAIRVGVAGGGVKGTEPRTAHLDDLNGVPGAGGHVDWCGKNKLFIDQLIVRDKGLGGFGDLTER